MKNQIELVWSHDEIAEVLCFCEQFLIEIASTGKTPGLEIFWSELAQDCNIFLNER